MPDIPVSKLAFISLDEAESVCLDALSRLALSEDERAGIWEQLLYAELRGKRTHGLVRVPWLLDKLKDRTHTAPRLVSENRWISHYDCRSSVGYLAAVQVLERLAVQAAATGLYLTVCRDIFPTGVLSFYLKRLVDRGQVGIIFGTTPPLVRTRGAQERFLGTNPIAVGFPGTDGESFVCDITTARTSFGQVLLSAYGADPLPANGLITGCDTAPGGYRDLADERGAITGAVLQGFETGPDSRQFALLTAIELTTAFLAGQPSDFGNLILIALDPNEFPEFSADAARAVMSKVAAGIEPELLPGLHGDRIYRQARERGMLRVPAALWREICRRAIG